MVGAVRAEDCGLDLMDRPTSLYRFYDADDQLLYVGISLNVFRRMAQHSERKTWWTAVARSTVEWHPTREAALEAERIAIRDEKPLHNIQHARTSRKNPPTPTATDEEVEVPEDERQDRLGAVLGKPFDSGSLVGSFFLSTARPGWQGCVVAEPAPGVYLVETFSWVMGESYEQRLVRLEEMGEWTFYDTAEWMRNAYDHQGHRRWEREREEQDGRARRIGEAIGDEGS